MAVPGARAWGAVCAALVAVIAGVHLQQYISFMSRVPTLGPLFLLNAAGGAALSAALLGGDPRVRGAAVLGGAGLAAGSLIAIAIALQTSLFGYHEPSLRLPIVIALAAELAALPALAVLLVTGRRRLVPAGS
jgi:hypothetical protein